MLGLQPRRCGAQELRRAYKMTALKVHPDKCSEEGAIEAFNRLQEAFSVLNDPSMHARYAQNMSNAKSMAAAGTAARRAQNRNAAYASRARMTKEEMERQVKEMLARQSKARPMAQSAAAQKAAEDRVARERQRQERLAAEEKRRQNEAQRRREESEKALSSARSRSTPRRVRTPVEEDYDPVALKAAEERARKRAASMAMLGSAMRWEVDKEGNLLDAEGNPVPRAGASTFGSSRQGTARTDGDFTTPRSSKGSATPRSGSKSPRRQPTSARSSPQASPFGDLKTLRRAQTERGASRPSSARTTPRSQYLPRFMQADSARKRAAADAAAAPSDAPVTVRI